jgi:hypothetical protein
MPGYEYLSPFGLCIAAMILEFIDFQGFDKNLIKGPDFTILLFGKPPTSLLA